MRDFQYSFPTKIIFGKSSVELLANEINDLGTKKIMLVCGKKSIKANGIYDDVLVVLHSLDIELVEFPGCPENPDIEFVDNGAVIARRDKAGLILAIGGGSVIDAAKAIALLASNNIDSIWQYQCDRAAFVNPAVPVGVVLTTAGTGSEVNGGFVLDNPQVAEKAAFTNLTTRPRFACCNPEYTYSLGTDVIRNNLVDILSHLLEQYFSIDQDFSYIDDLLVSSVLSLMQRANAVLENPQDYEARANTMLLSSVALSYMFSIGKEVHWTLHHIAHDLSALTGCAHGYSLAMLMPGWLALLENNEIYRKRGAILRNRLELPSTVSLPVFFKNFLEKLGFTFVDSFLPERECEVIDKIMKNKGFIRRSGLNRSDLAVVFRPV